MRTANRRPGDDAWLDQKMQLIFLRRKVAMRERDGASEWTWGPAPLRQCRIRQPAHDRGIQPPETGFRPSLQRSSAEWKSSDRRVSRAWKHHPGRCLEPWPCALA